MHKLMNYVCDELDTLEKKVEKSGDLSMTEVSYMGDLLEAKKDLLKIDEMENGASYDMSYNDYSMRNSYARNGRGRGSQANRDRMGRYSSERGYSRDDEFMSMYEGMPEHKKNELMRIAKEM